MAYPRFDLQRLRESSASAATDAPAVENGTRSPVRSPGDVLPLKAIEGKIVAEGSPVAEAGAELPKCRNQGGANIVLCGAELLTLGLNRYLIDFIERGLITHLALSPSGAIADWLFAVTGECPSSRLADLCGILRNEPLRAELAEALQRGDAADCGYGEALGLALEEKSPGGETVSVLAHAYRWGVPVTVHRIIADDPQFLLPGFDAALAGRLAYRDFLVLANSVECLEQGLILQLGRLDAGVLGFEAAWDFACQAAAPYGRTISDFTAFFASGSNQAEAEADTRLRVHNRLQPNRNRTLSGTFSELVPALWTAALQSVGWDLAQITG